MGALALSGLLYIFESLGIAAYSRYQRKAIEQQGTENKSPKAMSSNLNSSTILLLAAKI